MELYNNIGLNGGAVYLYFSILKLNNAKMFNNNAILYGGAIYAFGSIIKCIDEK